MKLSDSQAYTDALLKLNTSLIKNALWRWCYKLSNYHFNHEKFQSDSKNENENKAFKTV